MDLTPPQLIILALSPSLFVLIYFSGAQLSGEWAGQWAAFRGSTCLRVWVGSRCFSCKTHWNMDEGFMGIRQDPLTKHLRNNTTVWWGVFPHEVPRKWASLCCRYCYKLLYFVVVVVFNCIECMWSVDLAHLSSCCKMRTTVEISLRAWLCVYTQ